MNFTETFTEMLNDSKHMRKRWWNMYLLDLFCSGFELAYGVCFALDAWSMDSLWKYGFAAYMLLMAGFMGYLTIRNRRRATAHIHMRKAIEDLMKTDEFNIEKRLFELDQVQAALNEIKLASQGFL